MKMKITDLKESETLSNFYAINVGEYYVRPRDTMGTVWLKRSDYNDDNNPNAVNVLSGEVDRHSSSSLCHRVETLTIENGEI